MPKKMDTLNIHTLWFCSGLSRSAICIVFFVTALRQSRERHLWHWLCALVLSSSGIFLTSAQSFQQIPSASRSLIIYPLLLGSLTLAWSGLRRFYNRPVRTVSIGLAVLLPCVMYSLGEAVGLPSRVLMAFIITAAAGLAVLGVFEAVRPGGERLWAQYIVAGALSGYVLAMVLTLFEIFFTARQVDLLKASQLSLIFDQSLGVMIYFGFISMNGERAKLQLRREAETDPLTGLYNRRSVQAIGGRGVSRDIGKRGSLGLVLIDVDHFKRINDTYGHHCGDHVLVTLAKRINQFKREKDRALRWGGEEFLIILQTQTREQTRQFAERLCHQIAAEPFTLDNIRETVTVSIGFTWIDAESRDFDKAIQRADDALYLAKSEGRNRSVGA